MQGVLNYTGKGDPPAEDIEMIDGFEGITILEKEDDLRSFFIEGSQADISLLIFRLRTWIFDMNILYNRLSNKARPDGGDIDPEVVKAFQTIRDHECGDIIAPEVLEWARKIGADFIRKNEARRAQKNAQSANEPIPNSSLETNQS